jgi:Phospholipase_D-nuclease N-terminal
MELITPEYGLIIWSIFAICLLLVWILAIVSIAKSDFIDHRTKLMWGLVVFFLPYIGTLLYYSIGRNQRINNH